ncbi:MAG: hypothetical protein ACYDFT_04980 [Thermoplasmata archaeon]
MDRIEVLVVGETPSLGRSLRDLLESGLLRTRYTEDPAEALDSRTGSGGSTVVVVACTGLESETARGWLGRGLPRSALLVVGVRDPARLAQRGVRGVSLPIDPAELLDLVGGMLGAGRAGSDLPGGA